MDKKMTIAATVLVAMCAGVCVARPGPHGGFRRGPAFHHAPPSHHHHHYSAWGRGGSHFWPGFVGGVVGGIVSDAIIRPAPVVVAPAPVVVPAPVVAAPVVVPPVVAAPVYTTQSIWVEGCYVDQVQPNGTIVRIWQPGHYEQRQVQVR